jgi:ATP-binding cassette subfamily F protein 3
MELVETRRKEKTIRFSFPEVARSGREAASIEGVSKWFGDNILYEALDLRVLRGERIAIIGPNGCGKTTLLRLMAGELEPDRGRISLGHEVSLAYFAQHHSDWLNPRNTIIEEVYQVVPHATVGYVRSVCGAFLFSGNDVDKPIGVLSGGERARVSLAKLLVKPGNFMLLDEPTNHLDIESSETLIHALAGYGGTLLFVSHNQSFVNSLATKIWDIMAREIVEYPGRLEEYYDHLRKTDNAPGKKERQTGDEKAPEGVEAGEKTDPVPCAVKRDRKSEKREKAKRRQIIHDILNPIQKQLQQVEARIAALESRQQEVEKTLADPHTFADKEISVPLLSEYRDIRDELDEGLLQWEETQHKLESTKKRLGVQN